MKKYLIIIFLFIISNIHAQIKNYVLSGQVISVSKEPLIGATVVLLNPIDSTLISYATTDNDGKFTLKRVKQKEYKLQITYIGFGTFEKILKVEGETIEINLGDITLATSDQLLDQVEIVAEMTPIQIKKDTIEYNADAYRVRPNATVEELLKKLPGIEVDEEGTITAHGEEVKKVTVDGKKFFGDDPKMATKNLPADAVKKVQVFDKKSDRAEFTGVSDGETEKTINLELKADKKIGTFGEVAAGYNFSDRFESRLSLNKFNAKYQIASLANFNNVSNQGFSFTDYSTMMGSNPFGRGNDFNGVVNFGNNSGEIKSLTAGLNLYYEFSKKFNINTNYFITYADQYLLKNINKENVTGSKIFFSSEDSDKNSLRKQHNVNFNFQLKPDSFTRMDFESYIRFNANDIESILSTETQDVAFNKVKDTQQTDGNDSDVKDRNFRLNITRRLKKPGRILSLNTSYGLTDSDTEYNIHRSDFDYINAVSELLIQEQISHNDNNNINITAEYKEPLGNKNYLGIGYSRRNYATDVLKDFYDIEGNLRQFNDSLSALSLNDLNYNRYFVQYTKDNDNYNVNANLTYQQSELVWSDGSISSNPINPKYNYLLPSLNINWTKNNLRFRYYTSIDEPNATQLQPIVNNSDPLNLYKGNPNLTPEYSHTFSLRYSFFDNFNFRNLFSYITYRYVEDKIVNAQSIDNNFIRIATPTNTKGYQSLSFNITYSSPIRELGIKSRIFANTSLIKSINFINETQNDVTSTKPRIGIELENLKNKSVSLTLGTEISYEQNKYSISSTQNTAFTTMRYWSNLLLQLGKGWNIDANVNHTLFSKERYGDNNKLTFLNTSLSKRFYKNRITTVFRINDALNTGSGITRSVGDTYVEQVYSNAIGRYIMLSISYKLSAFNPQQGSMPPSIRIIR